MTGTRSRSGLLALLAVLLLLAAACGGGGAEDDGGGDGEEAAGDHEEIVIDVVSSHDRDDKQAVGFWMWAEKVQEKAPWVTINHRGGPEVMESPQHFEAVNSGAVDMAQTALAFYAHEIPMVDAMKLTPFMPAEERENGVYDILQEEHQSRGVHYLGRVGANLPFKFWFNKEIDGPDFGGLQMRTSPVYVALLEALGAAPVQQPIGEIYTSMERGVVDGFGYPAIGFLDFSWDEVTQYELDVPFYENDLVAIMNLSLWESLDAETQQAMTEAMEETEVEIVEHFETAVQEEFEERQAAGVEVIEFTPEEEEQFLETAYEAAWDQILQETPDAQKLRDIFGN